MTLAEARKSHAAGAWLARVHFTQDYSTLALVRREGDGFWLTTGAVVDMGLREGVLVDTEQKVNVRWVPLHRIDSLEIPDPEEEAERGKPLKLPDLRCCECGRPINGHHYTCSDGPLCSSPDCARFPELAR